MTTSPGHSEEPNASNDRHKTRATRTRQRLLDTLYLLALEKDFRDITVQELFEKAGVARSTFYAHFRDKEDMLAAGYESIGTPATRIISVAGVESVILDVARWLFTATERHATLTTAFFNSPSQTVILAHLENILLIQVREHYRSQGIYQLNELRGEVAVRCFVSALSGLWLWWVRHDYPHPATEMIQHFDALMNNGTWP